MAHDLRLDLDVLLPDAHGDGDRCVASLVDALGSIGGVREVHVVAAAGGAPAQVCLHVDTGAVPLARLAERARATGAEVSTRYGHAVWPVRGITHASRAETAAALLRRVAGVLDASVSVEGFARIEFDREMVDEAGVVAGAAAEGVDLVVPAVDHHDHAHGEHDHAHGHGGRVELAVALAAGAAYVGGLVLDSTPLFVAAAAVTAVTVGRDVLSTLRARRFDIELLMWLAAAGAAALGHWSDAALLLVLFSLGHALEGFAMGRARRAIEALGELAPSTAWRRTAAGVEEVPVEGVTAGDVLLVKPNERFPADAVVVEGTSAVDESTVTGESIPVERGPGDRVLAGTLNGAGALDVRVARPASDSTLARVVRLVAEADTQVSPTQVWTQRVVRVFVPAVLALVAVLLVVPPLAGEPVRESFLRAMAVLVASSPCALAIATPSAVLAAIARAARSGVLVKGGGPLEDLGRVRAVAFDKTGTLTEGRPRLVDAVPLGGATEAELVGLAAGVEASSDHPLARAVTEGALARGVTAADGITAVAAVTGRGVTAVAPGGEAVAIGNAALFDGAPLPAEVSVAVERLEGEGRTTMIVRRGERFLGVLGVMDTPRAEAAAAVAALRALGIERVVLLSGDRPRVAAAVAAAVGVTEARGGLLPEDKVAAIRELATAAGGVAMVGDGVNDAPALATATVGIAMGAAGSDVALETADIALMGDRLDRLPDAVALARRASRVIRQNLVFSLGVVAVLIPATILGVGIGPAVIAHEGSTLVVVANALLLLAHRDQTPAHGRS